ncbi:MAG TPA: DNA cytosine methyltransferase [Bacilli bacterium]|jgi:DNA (cytosine-5)-methyltransferase 1|nr:DNA cytosine methyltransferase [Bacilli bacterium]
MYAADYGVPQKRERVIICGIRNDLKKGYEFPEPVLKESEYIPLKYFLEENIDEKYYFSERAVEGMLRAKPNMNKGRAQDINQPCNTVGAHLAKMSLNSTDPVLFENGRYRRFTPREVARIQSFPEEFRLVGSDTAQYRALGNAIPPVMFWYISKNIERFFRSLKE